MTLVPSSAPNVLQQKQHLFIVQLFDDALLLCEFSIDYDDPITHCFFGFTHLWRRRRTSPSPAAFAIGTVQTRTPPKLKTKNSGPLAIQIQFIQKMNPQERAALKELQRLTNDQREASMAAFLDRLDGDGKAKERGTARDLADAMQRTDATVPPEDAEHAAARAALLDRLLVPELPPTLDRSRRTAAIISDDDDDTE